MVIDNVWPKSFLAWLILPDCHPKYDSGVWEFPCGLCITDQLVATSDFSFNLLGKAHLKHHDHTRHATNAWSLISTVEEGEDWRKVIVTCDYPRELVGADR